MSHVTEPPTGKTRDLGPDPFGRLLPGARRNLMMVVGVVALAALVAAVYFAGQPSAAPAASGHNHGAAPMIDSARPVTLSMEAQRRIGITFSRAERSPLDRLVRTVAQVTYDETRVRQVVPRVDGYVEQLFVNTTGQPVGRGQPLFAIYSPMLVSAQEEMLLARRLTEQVAAGTPDAVQGAASLLESARSRLLQWQVPPEIVEKVLQTGVVERTVTLRSPVSGVVVEKSVLAGQRIMAGEVAYKIVDLSRVWIEGEVFEPDLPSVRVGQRVSAEFPALPGEQQTGRITYVYPTLNPDTRTARVRVEMANPDMRLKPGMYATFHFSAVTERVVNVPRSAVLVTGKRTLVFVPDPAGTLTPREVVLGRATDDRVEVLRGLREGETVVTAATFLVDAESNLGSALGGMGNAPGTELGTPPPHSAAEHSPNHAVPAGPPTMPGMSGDTGTMKPE
jgi:Cu(I)/Ag(I) efflux system membrane fusion protein